jgi:ABC-type enterochelin transport system ATPase subunit
MILWSSKSILSLVAITFLENLDLKKSNIFLTLGILKKDNINIGRLVKNELISTNRYPYDKSLPN